MRFARALALALLMARPAAAQEVFDISATETCMNEAISFEERQYCVGASARICMEYLGGSEAMARCAAEETAWWMARMDVTLGRIATAENVSAAQGEALARMQAAWLGYRDESCAFEQAFGSGEAASESECLLWKTGDQAVLLEDYIIED